MRRSLAGAVLACALAGCSSGDASPEEAGGVGEVAEITTGEGSIRLLTLSSPALYDAIDDVAALGLIDEIAVIGDDTCPTATGVVCVSSPDELEPFSGRTVVVGPDGPTDTLLDVVTATEPAALVVVGDPNDGIAPLASGSPRTAIRVVPPDFVGPVTVEQLAFLVAARDEVAAYDAIEIAPGAFVAVVHTALAERIAPSTEPTTPAEDTARKVSMPSVRWTVEMPASFGAVGLHERAVVSEGVLALLDNDGVARGFSAATGEALWSTPLTDEALVFPATFAAAADGIVVMGMGDQTLPGRSPTGRPLAPSRALNALDLVTGQIRWSIEIGPNGAVGHPVIDDDRVYVWLAQNDDDQALLALDLQTGVETWRFDAGIGAGPPRIHDGIVWTGNVFGVVFGVDAADGNEVFRFDAGTTLGLAGVASRPAVTDDLVLFGSDGGTFYAVDRATGEEAWTFDAQRPSLPSSPALADETVIFGSFDRHLYGLAIATGAVRWRYATPGAILSSPVVADGVAYVGTSAPDPAVHAVDVETGDAIWRLPTNESVGATPFVDEELVYIAIPGRLYAIER